MRSVCCGKRLLCQVCVSSGDCSPGAILFMEEQWTRCLSVCNKFLHLACRIVLLIRAVREYLVRAVRDRYCVFFMRTLICSGLRRPHISSGCSRCSRQHHGLIFTPCDTQITRIITQVSPLQCSKISSALHCDVMPVSDRWPHLNAL